MSDPTTAAISIRGVTKRFGEGTAVDDLSIDIREGEFLTLLGPSGCGKTTTLRMVAGFEEPDEGDILLRGEEVVGVPPNKRHVNMCFQNYALFPHMDVQQTSNTGSSCGRSARRPARARSRRCCRSCGSRATSIAGRASSRAASSSALRSPGRS